MPFAICGVAEVPSFAAVPIDHIISFRDHRQPAPDIQAFKSNFSLHNFVFDDTGDPSNARACTEQMMRHLLSIYAQINLDQGVLFHCFAGVSRSSAAAFIWLVYHGTSYERAYQLIITTRGPFVCPNQLMVKLADSLMGHDGEMSAFLSAELGRRAPEREEYFRRASAKASLPRS